MEIKEEQKEDRIFMEEYYELRSRYDTRNMTEEQIMNLPCNKELKKLNPNIRGQKWMNIFKKIVVFILKGLIEIVNYMIYCFGGDNC